jgi:hypothetical protein
LADQVSKSTAIDTSEVLKKSEEKFKHNVAEFRSRQAKKAKLEKEVICILIALSSPSFSWVYLRVCLLLISSNWLKPKKEPRLNPRK